MLRVLLAELGADVGEHANVGYLVRVRIVGGQRPEPFGVRVGERGRRSPGRQLTRDGERQSRVRRQVQRPLDRREPRRRRSNRELALFQGFQLGSDRDRPWSPVVPLRDRRRPRRRLPTTRPLEAHHRGPRLGVGPTMTDGTCQHPTRGCHHQIRPPGRSARGRSRDGRLARRNGGDETGVVHHRHCRVARRPRELRARDRVAVGVTRFGRQAQRVALDQGVCSRRHDHRIGRLRHRYGRLARDRAGGRRDRGRAVASPPSPSRTRPPSPPRNCCWPRSAWPPPSPGRSDRALRPSAGQSRPARSTPPRPESRRRPWAEAPVVVVLCLAPSADPRRRGRRPRAQTGRLRLLLGHQPPHDSTSARAEALSDER